MKKGRPATMVSALCSAERLDAVRHAFFLNSTTLGLRVRPTERFVLGRAHASVETPYGPVRIKVAALDGRPIGAQPEFEDCRKLAIRAGVPVRQVWTAALAQTSAIDAQPTKKPLRKQKSLKPVGRTTPRRTRG